MVQFCTQPCDPRRGDQASFRGRIVLDDPGRLVADLPDSVRHYLRRREPYLLYRAGTGYNACFAFEPRTTFRTLAGISRASVTKWESSDGRMSLPLYESPDAVSLVTVYVRGGELHGYGISAGGGARTAFPRDSVWGRRVGPPDYELCIRAIEEKAATEARERRMLPRSPPADSAGTRHR